jgi:hypothetical protein
MSFHCARCLTPVVYTNVSEGYFAVCPEHDEDLYSIEVGWCCDYCGNELCSCKDPDMNPSSPFYGQVLK